MKSLPIAIISGTALVAMSFSGCETPQQGAGTGTIAGGFLGALAGGNLRSAAIGAGAGAITGAVLGKISQDERRAGYVEGAAYEYRYAAPSRYCGYVISPYRPHALVDVRGIAPGARVVDPASGRIFINP